MTAHHRVLLALLCALAAVALTVGVISALGGVMWTADGTAISTASGTSSRPEVAPDGSHGAIIAWHENRIITASANIYAQRVDSNGAALWITNGVTVCEALGDQYWVEIAADESGGATLVWEDYRSLANLDIYAQRVNSDGSMAWASDGVSVCAYTSDQKDPQIVSDGAGGALISWTDQRANDENNIYAQRVYSTGAAAWTIDGVAVCTSTNYQDSSQLVSDGAEGAIVVWEDPRGSDDDIYAQRVYSDGTPAWTANGEAVCTAADDQEDPQIVSDGMGGAIVAWMDFRFGSYDIYVQRVYSNGTMAWATDGVSLCAQGSDQYYPQIVSDGAGGAIVAWNDKRPAAFIDIYARRVYSDGTPAWTADGVSMCDAARNQAAVQIASDGVGGAIVVWHDYRSNSEHDIYAQRVDGEGNVLWQDDGLPVCTASGDQWYPELASDGYGGAIAVWEDHRGLTLNSNSHIFAQRVGTVGVYLPMMVKQYQ